MEFAPAGFLNPLQVQELNNGEWVLIRPLVYRSNIPYTSSVNTVPNGFITDFCSIPRLPIVYALLGDRFRAAGALHDYLYKTGHKTRRTCDRILKEAVGSLGGNMFERNAIYSGVRLFGWLYYKGKR